MKTRFAVSGVLLATTFALQTSADPAAAATLDGPQLQAQLLTSSEVASLTGVPRVHSVTPSCVEDAVVIPDSDVRATQCQRMFFTALAPKGGAKVQRSVVSSFAAPEDAAAVLAQYASTSSGIVSSGPGSVVRRFVVKSSGSVGALALIVSGQTVSMVECVEAPRSNLKKLVSCALKAASRQLQKSAI